MMPKGITGTERLKTLNTSSDLRSKAACIIKTNESNIVTGIE